MEFLWHSGHNKLHCFDYFADSKKPIRTHLFGVVCDLFIFAVAERISGFSENRNLHHHDHGNGKLWNFFFFNSVKNFQGSLVISTNNNMVWRAIWELIAPRFIENISK